jgi:hypothetical protein
MLRVVRSFCPRFSFGRGNVLGSGLPPGILLLFRLEEAADEERLEMPAAAYIIAVGRTNALMHLLR